MFIVYLLIISLLCHVYSLWYQSRKYTLSRVISIIEKAGFVYTRTDVQDIWVKDKMVIKLYVENRKLTVSPSGCMYSWHTSNNISLIDFLASL